MAQRDSILLSRFAGSGDPEAFSQIVNQYSSLVYSACHRMLNDRDAAADTTQDTFFQLLKNAGSITGSISAWLHRVATNKSVDFIRRNIARREREAMYSRSTPEVAGKWEDVSPYIDEALEELDEQVREMLIMHFCRGARCRILPMSLMCPSQRCHAGSSLASRGFVKI